MSNARIYEVKNEETAEVTLVKANNQAQAMRHIARRLFKVRPATALEVADHMAAGVKVEDATKEPAEPAEEPQQ